MSRTKFPDWDRLVEAAGQVQSLAMLDGAPAILVGGMAMQFYGSDRLTMDVDFAGSRLPKGLKATESLYFGGHQTTAPNGVQVDFIVRDDDYAALYREVIRRGANFFTIEELQLVVAQPEYLMAMKMAAGREKDMLDISHLLGLKSGQLDLSKTKAIVRTHLGVYAGQELASLVEEAEWMRSRKNPRARKRRR